MSFGAFLNRRKSAGRTPTPNASTRAGNGRNHHPMTSGKSFGEKLMLVPRTEVRAGTRPAASVMAAMTTKTGNDVA